MQPLNFRRKNIYPTLTEREKLRQMKIELRALLNETLCSLHPGSEEFGKVRRFMQEYLIAPNEEWDVRNYERTYKNNTGAEL
jgi:hypothetical protein